MLSQAQRTTILELTAQGVSQHEIARMLGISRPTVRKVVRSNSTAVPEIARAEKAEPYRRRILELFSACKENLVRVHEELTAEGAALSYAALTAFCRRQGIGQVPVVAAGQYHFEPGEEMQQKLSGNSNGLNIARMDQWLVRSEAQNTFCGCSGPHVAFYRQFCISTDLMQPTVGAGEGRRRRLHGDYGILAEHSGRNGQRRGLGAQGALYLIKCVSLSALIASAASDENLL